MRQINYDGLCDLWDDFSSAITEEKVNLTKASVYQVDSITSYKEDPRFMVARVNYINSDGMEGAKKILVSSKISAELERIGCFYEIDKVKYIPADDVRCRCLYDYFGITSDMAVTGLSEKEAARLLIKKFRSVGKIYFIARRKEKGFRYLVGMKSACGDRSKLTIMDVAKSIIEKCPNKVLFYSDYMNQRRRPGLDFQFMCNIDESKTKDGTPIYISVCDNASGRKSMKIAIVADINDRLFILDSKEINHRILCTGQSLADEAIKMLNVCKNMTLNIKASADMVKKTCIQYIPKKSREKFSEFILKANITPIEAAYDAMSTDIFNPKSKVHKTQDYDGGKAKYEIALGSVLQKY